MDWAKTTRRWKVACTRLSLVVLLVAPFLLASCSHGCDAECLSNKAAAGVCPYQEDQYKLDVLQGNSNPNPMTGCSADGAQRPDRP
jgi:hypothetical protein